MKALAPELPHKAKLGGVRLGLSNPTDVEVAAAEVLVAARRAGAASPRVLVQEMASGTEVLVGAVVDERFGALVTARPGGVRAEAGDAVFVPAPLTPAQARRYALEQAGRCGLDGDRHDLARVREGDRGDRAGGARPPRAPHLARGQPAPRRPPRGGRRRRARRGPAARVIFGLGAALGWGIADLWAAMSGRRIGSGPTVLVAQVTGAVVISAVLVVVAPDLDRLWGLMGWLAPNAVLTALAYWTLYRGLELGPVAVVSPVLASYAVIPVLLAVVLLDESLGGWKAAGVAVTIAGAVLTSTDLRALRAGTATRPPGLSWAIASTLLFGVATFVVGWASQRAGSLPSLWFARTSSAAVFVVVALVLRVRRGAAREERRPASAFGLAAAVGVFDLAGTLSYVWGSEVGLVSIVTAASAVYPVLPVLGGVLLLQERPAVNQYVGVGMVVGGLLLLGAG